MKEWKEERDIPNSIWNTYLKKYEKEYRVKKDENDIYQILCRYGNIQLYSMFEKKLCAALGFRTSRHLTGFLTKIKGLDYTISQRGDSDIVIVFNEKDLSKFTKACIIRMKRKCVKVTPERREQLRKQLELARKKKIEISKKK